MTAISYGIAETIGFRREMEDAHSVRQDERIGMFSAEVYDGHGGSLAASIAAERLTPYFFDTMRGELERTGKPGFTPEALRDAYLLGHGPVHRGSRDRKRRSRCHAYLHGGLFLAANAGDVRVVIGEGARAISLTVDHKPDLPDERARIEAQGGRVIHYDVPRVQGVLAMSRSLGDAPLKPFVTAEPRIAQGFLGRKDDIAIIACDGIWDVLTTDDAVAIARGGRTPEEAATLLLQTRATERGSTDNITVIVLDLRRHAATCDRDRLSVARIFDKALCGT